MGAPAAVMGDTVTAICVGHQLIGPLGVPIPAPPMPFSAAITVGADPTVLITGKPAVVMGASGLNMPPHVGLHATDPFMIPLMQKGQVVSGSTTVLIGGKPAATAVSTCIICLGLPGTLVATAATVLIGGG